MDRTSTEKGFLGPLITKSRMSNARNPKELVSFEKKLPWNIHAFRRIKIIFSEKLDVKEKKSYSLTKLVTFQSLTHCY